MDRIYRVIAIRRDGVWQYWEPVLSQFTFKEIPTNRYYKYTEALREYRRAIDKASPNETLNVSLEEKRGMVVLGTRSKSGNSLKMSAQKNRSWKTLVQPG